MPKKKPTENTYERPMAFPRYTPMQLTGEEREAFMALVRTPVFQKALRNALSLKPSIAPNGSGCVGLNEQSLLCANNRLHQIQGWEMFEGALFLQGETPKKKPEQVTDEEFKNEVL